MLLLTESKSFFNGKLAILFYFALLPVGAAALSWISHVENSPFSIGLNFFCLNGLVFFILFSNSKNILFGFLLLVSVYLELYYCSFLLLFFFLRYVDSFFEAFYRFCLFKVFVFLFIGLVLLTIASEQGVGFVKNGIPFYSHVRHLSYDIFWCLCCSVFIMCKSRFGISSIVLFLTVILSLIFYGRGALLAIFVFVVGCFFICRKIFLWCFFLSILAFVFSFFFFGDFLDVLLNRAFSNVGAVDLNRYSSGRVVIWDRTIQYSINDGWFTIIFGHLNQHFFEVYQNSFKIAHPHNAWVQVFFDFGLVGLVLFCLYLVLNLRFFYLRWSSVSLADKVVFMMFVSSMVYALFDGVYYHFSTLLFFVFLCSYISHLKRESR
jgi:O-antigen ligase